MSDISSIIEHFVIKDHTASIKESRSSCENGNAPSDCAVGLCLGYSLGQSGAAELERRTRRCQAFEIQGGARFDDDH